MIPLTSPERQNERLSSALEKALQRALVTTGTDLLPEITALESDIAQRSGYTYGIGLASLPDSLLLSLRALGLESDDEVIVPAYGYAAPAQAVLWAGLKPAFADVCPQTGLLTVDTLKVALTKRTRAVIALDLYGRKPDLAKLRDVCNYYGLVLIEEASHAPALPSRGPKAHLAVTGFGPDTPISIPGFAAIACCSDAQLAQRLREMSRSAHVGKFSDAKAGTRSLLDPFQAALLRTKLTQLSVWQAMRRTIAGWYQKAFYPYSHPQYLRLTPPVDVPEGHAWTYFPMRLGNGRESLRRHLLNQGIATDVLFPRPLPQVAPFSQLSPSRRYPGAELWCQEAILLPTFAELSAQEIETVIGSVTSWLKSPSISSSTNR